MNIPIYVVLIHLDFTFYRIYLARSKWFLFKTSERWINRCMYNSVQFYTRMSSGGSRVGCSPDAPDPFLLNFWKKTGHVGNWHPPYEIFRSPGSTTDEYYYCRTIVNERNLFRIQCLFMYRYSVYRIYYRGLVQKALSAKITEFSDFKPFGLSLVKLPEFCNFGWKCFVN